MESNGLSWPTPGALQLSASMQQTLLYVARHTLEAYLCWGQYPAWHAEVPALSTPRAVFVTLRTRSCGELRGCRGDAHRHFPLIEAVASMALAAATDDPRFPNVTCAELPDIHIEINVLTPLQRIRPDEVEVGRHGLMIVKGERVGLLLPQVPCDFGWNRVQFLCGLCAKAGLSLLAWRAEDAQLYAFETEQFEESAEAPESLA